MTRDDRLRVQNRLQELRQKYGRALEDRPLPDYLDHLPEPQRSQPQAPQRGDPVRPERR